MGCIKNSDILIFGMDLDKSLDILEMEHLERRPMVLLGCFIMGPFDIGSCQSFITFVFCPGMSSSFRIKLLPLLRDRAYLKKKMSCLCEYC
jgi:hypothetical protein